MYAIAFSPFNMRNEEVFVVEHTESQLSSNQGKSNCKLQNFGNSTSIDIILPHASVFTLQYGGTLVSTIMKTYLYYFDPLEPHFYMAKLGFTRLYIIFLISAQNIDCGYS